MTTEILNPTPDCEIVSSRIFNVPQEQLFRAWKDPAYLKFGGARQVLQIRLMNLILK
jgi:hypothetical protein